MVVTNVPCARSLCAVAWLFDGVDGGSRMGSSQCTRELAVFIVWLRKEGWEGDATALVVGLSRAA